MNHLQLEQLRKILLPRGEAQGSRGGTQPGEGSIDPVKERERRY